MVTWRSNTPKSRNFSYILEIFLLNSFLKKLDRFHFIIMPIDFVSKLTKIDEFHFIIMFTALT